jgi:hypothetical protein
MTKGELYTIHPKLPEEGGKQDFALERVTHLRIYSPFTGEPQKQ